MNHEEHADRRVVGSESEGIDRFQRLLDTLESHLDSGFFLSLIGKIVVDEKKIFSVLSELRSLWFEFDAIRKSGATSAEKPAEIDAEKTEGKDKNIQVLSQVIQKSAGASEVAKSGGAVDGYAESVRRGADLYAAETLDNLEQTLQKMMGTLREGKKVLHQRLAQEVKENGSA